jgi:deazaflavin-dependent oxidoreductase (nitroreductase family)
MHVVPLERAFARLQLVLYRATDGRLGPKLTGVSALALTTTGRRSGLPRSAVLVYAQRDEDMVVVASNYGGDRPPAWLLNLQAQPRAQVQAGRRRMTVLAREVAPGDAEYAELWALVNAHNHNRYVAHQRDTARPIPLVVLIPESPVAA